MASSQYFIKKFINYDSENSFAFKLRKKRAERIILLINECYNDNGKVDIIDIGGTKTYWDIIAKEYLIEKNVHIELVNIPTADPLPANDPIFSFQIGDGCNLEAYKNKSFDIAHSNSVIEHVGEDENRLRFAQEIKRVAKRYYIQTPNFWFPIEPHYVAPFIHWLPKVVRIKLVQNLTLGWIEKTKNYNAAKIKVENCNLLSKKEMVKLFPEANLYKEKLAFFTKSLILIDNNRET